jgi:hypothetical protein
MLIRSKSASESAGIAKAISSCLTAASYLCSRLILALAHEPRLLFRGGDLP